jgi:hypothetical protein
MRAKLRVPFILILPAVLYAARSSSVTLHSSPSTAEFGHPVTLTAVVSPATATGTVTFYNGTTILEIEPVSNGKAILTTGLLPAGTLPLHAHYSGNSTYAPSTSAIETETVKTAEARDIALPVFQYDTYSQSMGLADFNGDGKTDIALASGYGALVFLGNGDGTFQSPTSLTGTLSQSVNLAIGDFFGNGIADIFTDGGDLYAFFGNGDGTFQPAINSHVPASFPVIADFNGDGKADVAAIYEYNVEVCVLLGNGDGVIGPLTTFPAGLSVSALAVGDFNGDGKPDIVALNPNVGVSILLGNGDGTFQAPLSVAIPNYPLAMVVADLNGDGKQDLAVVGDGPEGVEVLLGNGDGTFQSPVYYATSYASSIGVSDFNGDGKLDIFAGGQYLLLGNGDGTFQPEVILPTYNGSADAFALADFNGDGRVDIAATGYSDYTTSLAVQLGTLSGPSTTTLTASPYPSIYLMPVTLTATVSPSTAQGAITFYDNGTELETVTLKGGTASMTTSSLPIYGNSLSAAYSGDTYNFPSTGTFEEEVEVAPTSTTLLSSPNPSSVGQTVTLVAKMTPSATTGNVTFYAGSTILGTSGIVSGEATFSISSLPKGSHAMTATFLGSPDFEPSVSFIVNQVVN